jgi:hypothetical protein
LEGKTGELTTRGAGVGAREENGDWTSRPFMVENNVTAEDCESISNSQSVFPEINFQDLENKIPEMGYWNRIDDLRRRGG